MRRALLLVLLLGGCAQVLGLEDRKLESDASTSTASDAGTGADPIVDQDSGIRTTRDCAEYCNLAGQLCTSNEKVELFQTRETCLAVCGKYSGTPDPNANTLACRLKLLRGLAQVGTSEATSTCQGAGPGGGPPPNEPTGVSCGTDCGGFCALRKATCPQQEGDVDCERKCAALLNNTLYNADNDFNGNQDTLTCRIAHLSAAALYDVTQAQVDAGTMTRDAHCSHSGIRSLSQCDFANDKAPDCASYCKIVGVACTGDKAVFESNDQCMAFCAQLIDTPSDQVMTTGSKRCQRVGAYDALEGQNGGCQRASIAGDSCGGRAASYCYYAKKACPTQFAQAYPGDTGECLTKAQNLTDANIGAAFSITSTASAGPGDNMQCRLRRLLKFFSGDTSAENCAGALGLPGNNLCKP